MTVVLPSHAQSAIAAKPLSTGFLFEFAQRLFDRGELDEAQDVLEKILRADPQNSSVKRLLANIEKQKTAKVTLGSKVTQPSDIASDIMFIQKNVVQLEHSNRDLEFTIRRTLQENAFLFQTLSHRNHELLDLRKKFFGYEGPAQDANRPSMQKANDILDSYEQQIAQRDRTFMKRNQEISRIMKDAGAANSLLKKSNQAVNDMDSSANALEWKNDLTEKRSYLIEKALTLYEKHKDLTVLHTELSAVSKSLKEANESYGNTVQEYEAKIQKLNNVWVQDKAKQQSEIDGLKEQIKNEKVKMYTSRLNPAKDESEEINLDNLSETPEADRVEKPKSSSDTALKAKTGEAAKDMKTQTAGLDQKKPTAVATAEKARPSANADSKVKADPQSEIKRLQAELFRKQKELDDRSRQFDAKIRELKGGWAQEKTIERQALVRDNPEFSSETNSSQTSEILQQLDDLKDQLSLKENEIQKFQDEMANHAAQFEDLQKKLNERDNRLAQMDTLIAAKDKQILSLTKELKDKVQVINKQNTIIDELRARTAAQTEVKDLGKRVVAVKSTAGGDQDEKPVDELKALVAELESRIGPDAGPADYLEDIKSQLAGSLETIEQKDREIEELKAQLDDQKLSDLKSSDDGKVMDARVKDYEQTIKSLNDRLAEAASKRLGAEKNLQEANKKLTALVDDMKKSKEADAGASSKRVEDLTKKIAELTSQVNEQNATFDLQLQTLRDKIALKNTEISGLKVKLAEKEKQVQQFYESLEQATEKLKSPSSSPVVSANIKEPIKEKASGDWDPADNDVYSLQQRLNTLSKELDSTREELARTKESGGPGKNLGKLEKELALFKQQSELTKTTIKLQRANLAKSQKEAAQKERSLKLVMGQLEKLKGQVGDYKATIKEKNDQIVLQQKALDHETQKNDTLNKKLRNITKTIGSEQELETEQDKSTSELRDSLKTYEIRERDYKRQISEIQDQLNSSYVMIEDSENRIATLKQRLAVREERIAQLEEELTSQKGTENQTGDAQITGQEK